MYWFFFSVDRDPPIISDCSDDIDFRVDDSYSTIYDNGSVFYIWTIPTAVDSSLPNIGSIEPYFQTRSNYDYIFHPGITTVTHSFEDRYGNVAKCSFDVTVRKINLIV